MSIKDNIARLRTEIAETCARAGREESEITIVAASKYVDYDGVSEAFEAGIRNFGENRLQDALEKIEKCPKEILWHFIGHLQRNKAAKVVGNFELIHSVDSFRLAEKIQQVAEESAVTQRILLEVNISGEESKFGLEMDSVSKLAEDIISQKNLRLMGFMTMAPFVDDEGLVHSIFKGLRRLRDDVQKNLSAELPYLSMGMTNDWQIAVEEGATHLRIGSAIFK
jgi:pyridoxal phosphate enzyme (YggS family)